MGPLRRLVLGLATLAGLTVTTPAAAAGRPDEDPVGCLALALYWEAKTEGRDGMLAVAAVILNRVRHPGFPGDVCAVVSEGGREPPCQFSWWCDGRGDLPTESNAWRAAARTAYEALHAPLPDPTGGALFFHDYRIAVPWAKPRERTAQIGRHIFYR
jgi:spore germination cell wall hydrolase CwlJ-like protein